MTAAVGTIPYSSTWSSLTSPPHDITIFMCYQGATEPYYFTSVVGNMKGDRVLYESYLRANYVMKGD